MPALPLHPVACAAAAVSDVPIPFAPAQTYKLINTRYYEAKKARQAKNVKEDYTVMQGDMLGPNYRVEESMGKGSFGQVVAAIDVRTNVRVAVKVIKNKEAFRRQARTEIRLLELLNRRDPEDNWCIGASAVAVAMAMAQASAHASRSLSLSLAVRFLEQFDHSGHTCLVFEHLAFNLYELLKRTHFRGVSLTLIRKFARQILKALAYLSLPEINVIHCDLKPENILFRVPVSHAQQGWAAGLAGTCFTPASAHPRRTPAES